MSQTVSCKSLHLDYRLWIAELNYAITLIRIFHDRLDEMQQDNPSIFPAAMPATFFQKLSECRSMIDELSHRMQIEKMTLAQLARDKSEAQFQISLPENYASIRNDFYNFRVFFNELKGELLRLETTIA